MPAPRQNDPRSILPLLIAAVFGFFFLPRISSESSTSPRTAAVAQPDSSTTETGSAPEPASDDLKDGDLRDLAPLRSYLSEEAGAIHSAAELERGLRSWAPQSYRTLVVTLPHPTDSVMGYRFDSCFEALQRALEFHRFSLDRYRIPWIGAPAEKTKPDQTPQPKPPSKAPLVPDPGVCVFRGSKVTKSVKVVVVFLVAESPVRGVNRSQLSRAFDLIARYLPGEPAPDGSIPIRIVGPGFSGSQDSLKKALAERRNACEPSLAFTVHASATELDIAAFQPAQGAPPIAISTFRRRTETVQREMLDYLRDRLGFKRIAILRESNTGLGILSRDPNAGSNGLFIDEYAFPMHISDLRQDYAKLGIFRPAEFLARTSAEHLDLANDEGRNARDLPRAFTPQSTAALTEMTLVQTLTALSRRDYEAIGILATDTRDIIFLAHNIRNYCRDAALFALQADLLFCSENSSDLRGMYMASTYSLAPSSQWRVSQSRPSRVAFGGELEQSMHNAAVAHFLDLVANNEPTGLLDYASHASLEQYRNQPPVQIGVVGERSLHPAEERGTNTSEKGLFELPSRFAPGADSASASKKLRIHSFFWVVQSGCALLEIAIARLLVVHALRRRRVHPVIDVTDQHVADEPALMTLIRSTLRLLNAFGPRIESGGDPAEPDPQRPPIGPGVYVLTAAFAAAGLVLGNLVILICGIAETSFLTLGSLALCVAFTVVHACLGGIALVSSSAIAIDAAKSSDIDHGKSFAVLFAFAAVATAVASVLLLAIWRPHGIDRVWLLERATVLPEGVSILTPGLFMVLAFLAWNFSQLQRRRENLSRYVQSKAGSPLEGPVSIHQDTLRRLRAAREVVGSLVTRPLASACKTPGLRLSALAAALAVAFCAIFFRRSALLADLETLCFLAFRLAFFSVLCIIAVHVVYISALWLEGARYLRAAASLPLLRAFDRIPAQFRTWFMGLAELDRGAEVVTQQTRALVARSDIRLSVIFDKLFTPPAGKTWKSLLESMTDQLEKEESGLHSTREVYHFLDRLWYREPVQFTPAATRSAAAGKNEESALEKTLGPGALSALEPAEVAFLEDWMRQAEDLIALQIVRWIAPIFSQIWFSVRFLVVAPVCLVLALNSYPFPLQGTLLTIAGAAIVVVIAVLLDILVGYNKDEVISRVSDTPPNRFTFDSQFANSFLVYVIPLLGALLSASYDLTDILRAWLGPVAKFLG